MRRILPVICVFLGILATDALAQSSTGRHRRSADPVPEPVTSMTEANDEDGFFAMAGFGLATSGDVMRVRSSGVSGIKWDPPGGEPFASPSYIVTLDENVALDLTVGVRLRPRLWARVDASFATLDAVAEAKIGEVVEVYRWGQFGYAAATITAEYRLTRFASFPFLLAGGGLTAVTVAGDPRLDQTRPSGRVGAGYQHSFRQDWGLRLEIRNTLLALDLAGYEPAVDGPLVPNYELEDLGPQHLWEIMILLQGRF